MDKLILTILAPERIVADRQAVGEVTIPTITGEVQILPGHTGFVGVLATGRIQYKTLDGKEHHGVVSTGFFEVKDETVRILAETFEYKSEIDAVRAKAAQQKAEDVLKDASLDEKQFRKYQLKLERALIRQSIHT